MGVYEVGLGDTVGVATSYGIERLLKVLLSEVPADKLAGHYHDTYGQAIANVVRSYDMGIRAFDSAVAGLGGCPYAPGAKGNVATEDLIYTLERAGIKTGVDLDALSATGDWISRQLGIPNNSRAGSAICAKAAATTHTHTSKDAKPSIQWDLLKDEGDYQVHRSGSAVKVTLARPKNGNALTNKVVRQPIYSKRLHKH